MCVALCAGDRVVPERGRRQDELVSKVRARISTRLRKRRIASAESGRLLAGDDYTFHIHPFSRRRRGWGGTVRGATVSFVNAAHRVEGPPISTTFCIGSGISAGQGKAAVVAATVGTMDALIAIPDLDDDNIYPLDGSNAGDGAAVDSQRRRPFRGAAAQLEHSRSGSAVSFESSNGSRTGPFGGGGGGSGGTSANGGSGSSSSINRIGASAVGGLSSITPTMPAFPRKSSFASLKAAFNKGPSTPTQDAYPQQLRNPFGGNGALVSKQGANQSSAASGAQSQGSASIGDGNARIHGRQDSYISSGSRGRAPPISSLRHVHQNSLYSDQSNGASNSVSESTSGASQSFRKGGPGLPPPMPPFPETVQATLPPARTAYARSMASGQVSQAPASQRHPQYGTGEPTGLYSSNQEGGSIRLDNHPSFSAEQHDFAPSMQNNTHGENAGHSGEATYFGYDTEVPLQPPHLPFAETIHGRKGSSGGSFATSEGGARPSIEQFQAGIHTPGEGSGPQRSDQGNRQSLYAGRDNSSVASLPVGIGLEDPKTPADYAINVLCSRFMTLAGVRVRGAIGGVDEPDPSLSTHLAKGQDYALDTLVDSLGHVSRKNPWPVIDSLFHWRNTLAEERVDVGDVRGALAGSQAGLALGVKNIADVLTRRKFLATAYLLTRVLLQVASQFSTGGPDNPVKGLSDAQLSDLQSWSFDLMRDCSRERCASSKMQADAFENAARLLGELSKSNFVAVGDRYVAYLEQCQRSANASAKDGDVSTETAVTATRYLSITPYPMELFEEGAEFFETMAKFFNNAHGQRIKSSYAEALTHLILPVAKSASAELHHPTWIRALDFIGPRAFAMLQKPRYWLVAYPLYTAVLCVSPEERFLQASQTWSWYPCLEAGVSKMSKDRAARSVVLNTALWLLWAYLFRCRESSSTTSKRLEAYFRIWFPPQRQTISPTDVNQNNWHVYMVHYALYRQFEFGRDIALDFLRHQTLGGNTLSLQPELLSKQRMVIAIRAILLTLDAHVHGVSPPFPSESDFVIEKDGLGDVLPEGYSYPTAEIGAAQAKFNDLIGKIALLCDHQIGAVTVLDEHVILTRGISLSTAMASAKGTADEERLNWRIHEGHRFIAAYAKDSQPFMDLLRACIEAWPRCLSSSIPLSSVLAVLFRAHLSADPRLSDAASQCLTRLASQRKGGAISVVSSFMRSIVRLESVTWETHPNQLLILSKVERAVKLLGGFLDVWLTDLKKSQAAAAGQKGWEMERTSAWAVIDEVEAIGLFLLCSAWRPLRRQAIGILRSVADLDDVFVGSKRSSISPALTALEASTEKVKEPTRIIHLLAMSVGRFSQPTDPKSDEDASRFEGRTQKWKRSTTSNDTLLEIAESDKSSELNTWFRIVPRFLRASLEHFPTTVAVFRSLVTSRIIGMESAVSLAAGTSNRALAGNAGTLKGQGAAAASNLISFAMGSNLPQVVGGASDLTPEQTLMCEHWKMYILALCTTTTSIEGGAYRILQGDDPSTERVIAAKDLFQKLVPYLASDQARLQDAVITALGNINSNLYKTLLETLQTVNAQLSDDFKRSGSKRNRRNERLRTALAQVIHLTSPHMTRKGTLEDQSIVFLVLQWVKETFNFLTDREIRPDWEFHRLRRFFAGVVEEFFDALHHNLQPGNDAAERFLTFDTKLRMFRLFRDWHSYSQAAKDGPIKLANLLATAAEQHREDRHREQILTLLRNETQLLSFQASSAMAALCQGAMSLADTNLSSDPVGGISNAALEPGFLFEWLEYLFRSTTPQNHQVASRALKALLSHNMSHTVLAISIINHSFEEPEKRTAVHSFFAVFSDVVTEKGFSSSKGSYALPPQVMCLGLVKLGHPDVDTRKKAFALLNCVVQSEEPSSSLQSLEGGVSSPLPATYLRAQRDVSTHLASLFQQNKVAMLCEYTLRLPKIDISRRATTLGLLPEWLHQIKLLSEDQPDGRGVMLPRRASLVLSNLLAMTIKYGDEHNFEIQDMWASLAESGDFARSATTIVKFLIQQALYLRTSAFIMHAKRAVSCLSHTVLAPALFLELCSYIEPSSMIPVPLEHERLAIPDPILDHLFLADIESLLGPPSRRQTFSPGQVALLYVSELTYEQSHLLVEKLPLLLHAIFMQVDSVSAFTQEQVMAMFEQLLRSLSNDSGDTQKAEQAERLFCKGTSIFWTQDDEDFDSSNTLRSMRATVVDTLAVLRDRFETLNEKWGNVALHWATSNPVRHMACRSFQMFRILLPDINFTMLADMLGRLSNTISDSARVDNQSFALEILYTLKAIVRSIKATDKSSNIELLSHIFWMNLACLSTVNEAEFGHSIGLMLALLECVDLNSKETVALLKSKCPEGWEGDTGSLQSLVMRGLKSSALCTDSFQLLAVLARIGNDDLVDSPDSRVGYLFMACMPWFLQMTDDPASVEERLVSKVAEDIASLASKCGKADLERVAASIAKKRFRTKDDLIRQAVGCCKRVGFLPKHSSGLVLLLLGITFNAHEWLRRQTLQLLKIVFQSMDHKRHELEEYGPELLMPLLRLLSTNHSMEALEVLDEKILSSGRPVAQHGPNAQQILRMSLQWNTSPTSYPVRRGGKMQRNAKAGGPRGGAPLHIARPSVLASAHSVQDVNSLFGQPEESGWSVANVPDWTSRTRINILSVFKEVELLLDTPPVGEVNFVDDYDADGENVFEQTTTASRLDVDDETGSYLPAVGAAQSSNSIGGYAEQQSFASHPPASIPEAPEDRSGGIGDIVNQLHDLSSFFIDDETLGASSDGFAHGLPASASASSSRHPGTEGSSPTSTRRTHFWGSSIASSQTGSRNEDANGDIAKVLSRSALAAMIGRSQSGRTASGASEDTHGTPTPIQYETSNDDAGEPGDYLNSKGIREEASPKRSGMFGRKSFFGRRTTPTAGRTASEQRNERSSSPVNAEGSASAQLESSQSESRRRPGERPQGTTSEKTENA